MVLMRTKVSKKRNAEAVQVSPKPKKKIKVLAKIMQEAVAENAGKTASEETPKAISKAFSVSLRDINQTTKSKTLVKYFSKFGEVTRVYLPQAKSDINKNMGHGSITFASKEAADAVLAKPCEVDGNTLCTRMLAASSSDSIQSYWQSGKRKGEFQDYPEAKAARRDKFSIFVRVSPALSTYTLRNYFSKFGAVEYISFPKSPENAAVSNGYAFVSFREQAVRDAVLALDNHEVQGTKLKIQLKRSQEKLQERRMQHSKTEKRGRFEIYVGRLEESITKQSLHKHFSKFGNIKNIFLSRRPDNPNFNKGYAFVNFATELDREKAVSTKKHELDGRAIYVRISEPKEKYEKEIKQKFNEMNRDGFEVFVKQLEKSTTEAALQTHFSQFGSVKYIRLPTQRGDITLNKGYAFIGFADELAREKAVAANMHEVDGKILRVRVCVPEGTEENKGLKHHKLFVFNIPQKISEEDLKNHFSQFGYVKYATLLRKAEDVNTHRSSAFIAFCEEMAVEAALVTDKHVIDGQTIFARRYEPKVNFRTVIGNDFNKELMKFSLLATGLAPTTTTETLALHFSRYGVVKQVKMSEKTTGGNAAVVVFQAEAEVKAALTEDHRVDYAFINVRSVLRPKFDGSDEGYERTAARDVKIKHKIENDEEDDAENNDDEDAENDEDDAENDGDDEDDAKNDDDDEEDDAENDDDDEDDAENDDDDEDDAENDDVEDDAENDDDEDDAENDDDDDDEDDAENDDDDDDEDDAENDDDDDAENDDDDDEDDAEKDDDNEDDAENDDDDEDDDAENDEEDDETDQDDKGSDENESDEDEGLERNAKTAVKRANEDSEDTLEEYWR